MQKKLKNKRRNRKKRLFKTLIFVRGFCSDFEILIKKDHFYSIEEALTFVQKEVINTSMVKGIVRYTSRGEEYISNENYTHPEIKF